MRKMLEKKIIWIDQNSQQEEYFIYDDQSYDKEKKKQGYCKSRVGIVRTFYIG